MIPVIHYLRTRLDPDGLCRTDTGVFAYPHDVAAARFLGIAHGYFGKVLKLAPCGIMQDQGITFVHRIHRRRWLFAGHSR